MTAGFVNCDCPVRTQLEDRIDDFKTALHDLVMCRSEQLAIGGGPGWKEREAKAWRAAEELFEP